MDLREFVKQALTEIVSGVTAAQASGEKGCVNPRGLTMGTTLRANSLGNGEGEVAQLIEFDVAVTVVAGDTTTAGGKLMVAGIGVGGSGQQTSQESITTRIKFSVPVLLPSKPWT